MGMLIVAVIFSLTLCAFAYQANARFSSEDRLPMQWWLTGEITWSAPRWLALTFIPALAIGVLSIFVIMSFTLAPRSGQETLVLPSLIGLGVIFIAIQVVHFWLIARNLRRHAE